MLELTYVPYGPIKTHSYKILKDISQQKSASRNLDITDFCSNSLFIGLSKNNFEKLQKVKNRAASLMCVLRRGESVLATTQMLLESCT